MNLIQIDKSDDYISECGMFKIVADNDSFYDSYFVMMRAGDGQDLPIVFTRLCSDPMPFDEAVEALKMY